MKPRLIFSGFSLCIYAVTTQARDFVSAFDPTQTRHFEQCAMQLERQLQTGRPSKRSEKLAGTRTALFEMKVTPPGAPGPQTRLLYARRGQEFFVMRGLIKRRPKIKRREVELADREALDWRERSDAS